MRAPVNRPPRWRRVVALGDSYTEGMSDTEGMPPGEFLGWADRLATILAAASPEREIRYANLGVRSRRVRDLTTEQVPAALALDPDLVVIFMGANDLVKRGARPRDLVVEYDADVGRLRDAGIDVLMIAPYLPQEAGAGFLARRFDDFADGLRDVARGRGALLVEVRRFPDLSNRDNFADDRVHYRSSGHRRLAFRCAELLGVPDAAHLAGLDDDLHEDPITPMLLWFFQDAIPWAWRRVRGRTAGLDKLAKHTGYVRVTAAGLEPGSGERPPRAGDGDTARLETNN
ncbi:SGNH/GDSL hydrolase family protein [Microbacterium indicum]|uniref:SGNH/GDSL hydrolase family protein n=1 Tax=Microbacterium indicum TaxID=358100 RepID=UPI0006876736|nr:SGNH/GDSL hydrolase family protein [Microbacterium indicum]